jgi:MFS family permease
VTVAPRSGRLERGRALAALLLAVFVVALGTGFILPILPSMIERLAGTSETALIARHTAFLTSAFSIAPIAVALPWGWLSDRAGRRPTLLVGLAGLAVSVAASALAWSLQPLYVARLLGGAFAAAVLPAALAFVADTASDEHLRARAFGWISIATSLGLLAGPMLGGIASAAGGSALPGATASDGDAFPFVVVTGLAIAAVAATWGMIRDNPATKKRANQTSTAGASIVPGEIRLLILAAVASGGLGAFEVGLTLRSRELAMTPAVLGFILAGCMLVMIIVQVVAFSPWIKPTTTRWFIAPAFVVMAVGLALIPAAGGAEGLLAATGMVAASGGLLTPLLAYWLSRISGRGQGTELGLQTAAVSLGLSVGALAPGALAGFAVLPQAWVVLSVVALAAAAVASLRLPADLLRGIRTDQAGLVQVPEERS